MYFEGPAARERLAAPTQLMARAPASVGARCVIGGLDAHVSQDVGDHVVEDAGGSRTDDSFAGVTHDDVWLHQEKRRPATWNVAGLSSNACLNRKPMTGSRRISAIQWRSHRGRLSAHTRSSNPSGRAAWARCIAPQTRA